MQNVYENRYEFERAFLASIESHPYAVIKGYETNRIRFAFTTEYYEWSDGTVRDYPDPKLVG